MIDENNINNENNDTADDLMNEDIIEYYKNLPVDDTTEIEHKPNSVKDKIAGIFKSGNRLTVITGDNNEIDKGSVFSNKTRELLSYCAVGLVCIAIIVSSLFIAARLPKDEARAEELASIKRESDDYKSLQSDFESINSEVESLKTSLNEKQSSVENIKNYEQSRISLRNELDSKKKELSSLNDETKSLQAELDKLNDETEKKTSSILTLSPGKYVVGSNIPPGKYSVAGSGKFMVADSKNKSKYNEVLNSSPFEIELNDGDIIKTDTTVKLTLIN